MVKELFIECINAINKQFEKDREIAECLGKAFPNAHTANLLPDNDALQSALIKVLQVATGDSQGEGSWIEHFICELDFGRENYRLGVYDVDGTEIPMNNAGELYDFLMKEKER